MGAKLKLWYDQPSTLPAAKENSDWNRALPVGNGRLGGMVFANIPVDRIQINEESIWAGPPVDLQSSHRGRSSA
ncbi:hypothetical protein J23TS9_18910 [Paenibacillus sp. J23TS9]|uniref:glycoside hydrolase N-terminal domain-containing protein n=1 Tax=Paenibacillus sp. J23TS9 TaxID=2807193 RepID=UPI001B279EFD|nr:glycoside hydrolase N-terminal domain-containing protein [Paenibacillus sp. J23TS9]GIP26761.1 hypothetical protein J23TS9_18910 [Paenibacillus sp. J23TS9]